MLNSKTHLKQHAIKYVASNRRFREKNLENLSIFRLWLKPVVSAKLRARPVFTLLVGLLPPVGQYLYITFHKIGTCSQMKEKEFTLTRPNVMASGKRPARAGGHVLTCTTVDHERLGY
jgi:hypothetical protein